MTIKWNVFKNRHHFNKNLHSVSLKQVTFIMIYIQWENSH